MIFRFHPLSMLTWPLFDTCSFQKIVKNHRQGLAIVHAFVGCLAPCFSIRLSSWCQQYQLETKTTEKHDELPEIFCNHTYRNLSEIHLNSSWFQSFWMALYFRCLGNNGPRYFLLHLFDQSIAHSGMTILTTPSICYSVLLIDIVRTLSVLSYDPWHQKHGLYSYAVDWGAAVPR